MGVPKFYRWISERYPKINEIVSDSALLPEFDHLYLDMNGIIHGCSHPSDKDISEIISERDMMLGIMHYMDRIITQIVKPKVSLYMAIDGVAPRAKLNQQRSRRFGAAKTMAEETKDIVAAEKANVFDSNCITPGTEFMTRVSETIKYFIRKKLKEDPSWKNLQVIFSGHECPGEGEHKIMEHIRRMKNQPGYRPNTRHCIYGQDADLIMLALVTHEPHFTILREVVDFGFGGIRNNNALKQVKKFTKESDFQLLHLSILREYINIEFCKHYPGTCLEHTVDDFVFMTFLVGNDFLPHLNTLDISEGAFDLLFEVYKEHRAKWGQGQYLTECGEVVNAARLEAYLQQIGQDESKTLEDREKNDAVYLKKKRRWDKRDGRAAGPSDREIAENESGKQTAFGAMLQSLPSKENATYIDGWTPVGSGEKDFKGRYYFEKLKITPIDIDAHHALRKAYVEGLLWCLAYYYKGCISWGWFYPYHYGPMLSDLRNLPDMFKQINFDIGAPLTPFQQLMGCLPPASSTLVPKPYRSLMTNPQSPIIAFYPLNFEIDMNGKKNPWEGVNLLPFINADLLKATIEKHCPDTILAPAERKRNRIGDVYSYVHDQTCNETVDSPNRSIGFTDIVKCHSRVAVINEPETTDLSFRPELMPGTQIPYPGFPSLDVIPIESTELAPIGLNCFGFPSKYPNTLLKLHQMPQLPPIAVLAENILGTSLFVNWPMMHEGKVVCISDGTCEVRLVKGKPKVKPYTDVEQNRWRTDSEIMMQGYMSGTGVPGSGGVNIGEISFRIKLLPLQGMKTKTSNGSKVKQFGKEEADVPLQLALWQSPSPDPRFMERGPMQLADRFPTDTKVVLTKGKYRGCSGSVVGVADAKKMAVKVHVMPPEVPFGLALARSVLESYVNSADAARILKIHPGLFGRITGTLLFEPGQYDLGLNLKSSDGFCVAGFTRQKKDIPNSKGGKNGSKTSSVWDSGDSVLVAGSARARNALDGTNDAQERIIWEYTPKAIRLVNEYRQKFPQLFNALAQFPNEKKYSATRIFGPNGNEWLPVVREWLNNIESAKLPRTPVSTDTMSREAVLAVEKAAEVRNMALQKKGFPTESLIKIPGSALYAENSTGATDVLLAGDHNDNDSPELGDRIANLCASGIPFGAKGTVIAIHQATTGCVEVVMDEEFVGGTSLQGYCSNFRGKLCVWAHLLKISVDNSKGLVDTLVPKGAGKQAVAKMLSGVREDSKKHSEQAAVAARDAKPTSQPSNRANPASRSGSAPRPRSVGRPRSDSGSKQAGWKEAQGPPSKGIGFKDSKKLGKNGLARWKKLILNKPKTGGSPAKKKQQPQPQKQPSTTKANELKAILGMSTAAAPPATATTAMTQPTVQEVMNGSKATVAQPATAVAAQPTVEEATNGLKAMLGLGLPPAPAPVQATSTVDTVAGLKNLLGVPSGPGPAAAAYDNGQNNGFPPPPPPPVMRAFAQPPAEPKTAADQLLRMLTSNAPSQGPSHHAPSSFNFTYTAEGKEAPVPSPPKQHPQPMYAPMMHMAPPHMQMQMPPVGMMQYGGQPVPMQMQMGHPPMPPMPMNGAFFGVPPPPQPPAPPGPSAQDFPPLPTASNPQQTKDAGNTKAK